MCSFNGWGSCRERAQRAVVSNPVLVLSYYHDGYQYLEYFFGYTLSAGDDASHCSFLPCVEARTVLTSVHLLLVLLVDVGPL